MGFKKTPAHGFFRMWMLSTPSPSSNLARPPLTRCLMRSDTGNGSVDPDQGDSPLSMRAMQWRQLYQSAAATPLIRSLLMGEGMRERLREMRIARDRIRLEGLIPPPVNNGIEGSSPERGLTVGDLKRLMRASQAEMLKTRLREIKKDWVAYSEFLEICESSCGGSKEEGKVYARMLDESGSIIVLGDSVCLRPDQET